MRQHHCAISTLLLAAIATPARTQSPPFLLLGPVVADYSLLPRDPGGAFVVRLTGTGFVPQMLLVGRAGPIGPLVLQHRYVDNHAIEFLVPAAIPLTAEFELYKLAAGAVVTTGRLTTQLLDGSVVASDAVFVATNGNDNNAGTRSAPFRTVARGVAALRPGKTLYLRGGTYFESVDVAVNGTEQQPITIRSFPGERAVLDSGPSRFRVPGNSDWELVDAAIGEYRSVAAAPSGTPYGFVAGVQGYENGRVGLVPYVNAASFRATSEAYVDSSTPFYVGPGLFRDSATGRLHVRLQKTADVRAVEARYGQVFATNVPDPRTLSLIVSQASYTLRLRGSHLVVRDLTVHQASRSIDLPSTVSNVLIDGVEVWLGDSAIDSNGAGSSRITVNGCRVYGDNPRWIFWTDAKTAPAPADKMRQTSIDFHNGAREVVIAYNHVRGGHDLVGVNTNERNFFVHHNLLENCHDDAAEFEGTIDIGRIEFHDNFVRNPLVAISPGQDSAATSGPLLFHHNLFVSLRNPPVNRRPGIVTWNGGDRHGFEYMLKQHSGNTFYYNNTMVLLNSSGKGINITPRRPEGTWCANNVMVMVNGEVQGSYRTGAGQIVDGNLYWKVNTVDSEDLVDGHATVPQLYAATGLEQHGLGSTPRRGTNPRFANLVLNVLDQSSAVWQLDATSESTAAGGLYLTSTSPSRNAGIVLGVHPLFGPLPEANRSLDLGAIPYGSPAAPWNGFPFNAGRSN